MSLSKARFRDFTQMLEVLAGWLVACVQAASHAEHDLAAHFGCDGDKDLLDGVFLSSLALPFSSIKKFITWRLRLHLRFKIVWMHPPFSRRNGLPVLCMGGSQISPLCSSVSKLLLTDYSHVLYFLHFIGFLMLDCADSSDFNQLNYSRIPSGYIFTKLPVHSGTVIWCYPNSYSDTSTAQPIHWSSPIYVSIGKFITTPLCSTDILTHNVSLYG